MKPQECRIYHAKHRDAILARQRARYAEKREADLARKAARRKANPDEGKEYGRLYYAKNVDVILAKVPERNIRYADRRRAWTERNKERLKQQAAAWTRNNSAMKAAAKARRLASQINATPPWVNLMAIRSIYNNAARLTKITGVPHEVDHIVPLRNRIVCGLHAAHNLQILTRTENRRKNNRLIRTAA